MDGNITQSPSTLISSICNSSELSGLALPNPYKGKSVLVYDKNNNFICEFDSIKETAKELNYSVNSVSCFLRNKKDCIKYNFNIV